MVQNYEFSEPLYFTEASFYGVADFANAIFTEIAIFGYAKSKRIHKSSNSAATISISPLYTAVIDRPHAICSKICK
jgi:hypothetical protein